MNGNVGTKTTREFALAVERMRRTLRRAGVTSETCTVLCERYRHALIDGSDGAWRAFDRAIADLRSHRPTTRRQQEALDELMLVLEDDFLS